MLTTLLKRTQTPFPHPYSTIKLLKRYQTPFPHPYSTLKLLKRTQTPFPHPYSTITQTVFLNQVYLILGFLLPAVRRGSLQTGYVSVCVCVCVCVLVCVFRFE